MKILTAAGLLAAGSVLMAGGVGASPAPVEHPTHNSEARYGFRAEGTNVHYEWPTAGPRDVVRPFEAPSRPWGPGHRGVDLAVAAGEAIYAPAAGVVAFAGWVVDRDVVSIQHADGLRTTFEPVTPTVREGQHLAAGDLLGHVASSGHCAGDCVHFGARRSSGDYLDPMALIGARDVIRLLPLG